MAEEVDAQLIIRCLSFLRIGTGSFIRYCISVELCFCRTFINPFIRP